MTDQKEIDLMLSVVGNQVRRKIIRRLSQEPSYPLELSKELGIGQQLTAAHLEIMEKSGVIGNQSETSPHGPSRKRYFLKKSVYISIEFGPHLYSEHASSFEALPQTISEDAHLFIGRIGRLQESTDDAKMTSFSDILQEIDAKLNGFEQEKAVLLHIRNLAMKNACEAMDVADKTHDERRILHYLLDERSENVEEIAASLNMREPAVRSILQSLKKELG